MFSWKMSELLFCSASSKTSIYLIEPAIWLFAVFHFKFDLNQNHCVKSARITSFLGPYLPKFGLKTDIYSVNLNVQSVCEEKRSRKTPNTDTFYAVNCN